MEGGAWNDNESEDDEDEDEDVVDDDDFSEEKLWRFFFWNEATSE